jgi:MarR family transcriptional regulator, 2-MHQ and catechol-resistance regulon repressor
MSIKEKITSYNHLVTDNQIYSGINILSTSSRVILFLSNQLKQFNLTFQQFNVLRILRQAESPVSIKAISDAMIDPSSNCSRLVDKLAQKKLAQRLYPPSDKRLVNVSISESGAALFDAATEVILTQFKGKLDSLTDEDLSHLNRILDTLKASIEV